MRKFWITLIVGIVTLIAGCSIFLVELSQIDTIENKVKVNMTEKQWIVDENLDSIDIINETYIDIVDTYSIVAQNIRENPNLAPNEIRIRYPEFVKLDLSQEKAFNDSTLLISFEGVSEEEESTIDKIMEIWKNKSVQRTIVDQNDMAYQVEYGSNLSDKIQIFDSWYDYNER